MLNSNKSFVVLQTLVKTFECNLLEVSDGIFGRTLQSIAQQKHLLSSTTQGSVQGGPSITKEPNLMPVPSPQQIQYLNAFEGQELIIQKQPNTSLKEGSMISPP